MASLLSVEESIKVRENRLRRAAERQGLSLQKNRRRDPRALQYATYRVVRGDEVIAARGEYGLTLDDVEDVLNGD